MAAFRCLTVKDWIYLSMIIGVTLFLSSQLKIRVPDDFKFHAANRSVSVTSSMASLGAYQGNTHQNQISLSGIERPQVVQEICRTLNISNSSDVLKLRGKFLLDHSIYYCNIPKCGSTFMDDFLSGVFQCNGLCDQTFVRSNTVKRNSETLRLMSNAYSFMFVREPYGRLFSAYENKLFLPNEHWKTLGKDIIKTVRSTTSDVSQTLGYDVTFLELVKYVLNKYDQGLDLNIHLKAMHMHCDACGFRFDFIGKLETMTKDLLDLVEILKLKGLVSNNSSPANEIETTMRYERSFGPYKHMFEILWQYRNNVSKYKLFQRAWSSYQIRGLILKKYKMPFSENEVANVNKFTFGDEIKKAIDASMRHKEKLNAQREEALIQAYRPVPMELLMRLKQFVKRDCLLFGYDDMPEKIFNKTRFQSPINYNYFKGL